MISGISRSARPTALTLDQDAHVVPKEIRLNDASQPDEAIAKQTIQPFADRALAHAKIPRHIHIGPARIHPHEFCYLAVKLIHAGNLTPSY